MISRFHLFGSNILCTSTSCVPTSTLCTPLFTIGKKEERTSAEKAPVSFLGNREFAAAGRTKDKKNNDDSREYLIFGFGGGV